MNRKDGLRRLLNPRTLAVIGGNSAREVIRQSQALGFTGEIWAVNASRREMGGVPCFATVAELPAAPDACFIGVPAAASVDIVRQLAERGAAGAVCFAAGFAEEGPEGAALQSRLRDASGNMAIIGPNCHGFLNYLDGVALWPDKHGGKRVDRGAALILQSGNVGLNLTMQQRGLPISHVITIGNKAMLGVQDYIDILLEDSRVTAIGLHIEALDDVHAFSQVAIRALHKRIPIVAIKTGRSRIGARMTMSHTSSLAGSDRLYAALFARLGIARCDSLPQFLETLKFLALQGSLSGNRVGSMSCSGGEASIVADRADALGLELPALSEESIAELRTVLGHGVHLDNPLDYHSYAWGNYDILNASFSAMLKNRFDCTLLILDYPIADSGPSENWEITERSLVDAAVTTGQRAVVVASLPETLPPAARQRLLSAGVTPMQGIEDCLYAIRAAAAIGNAQRRATDARAVHPPEPAPGRVITLDEWTSKAELAKYGLVTPAGTLCSAAETVNAATRLGFPVVLKAVSEQLAHKTEAGAVALNLQDAEAVRAATRQMSARFERFLVEKMVTAGIAELIAGVSRDPTFGLTLLLGAGGLLVEVLEDSVCLLLPASRQEVAAALRSLRISKVLDGYRGGPAADLEAIVDAVMAIAAFAIANNDSLAELDVNPLLVTAGGAVAVDALIRRHVIDA